MREKSKIRFFLFFLMGMITLLISNCGKDDSTNIPTKQIPVLTTTPMSYLSATSATCGGNVTSAGDSAVTERGVCWSTNKNPTISDNKITNGSGKGIFTCKITSLSSTTTYYVRAYARNCFGIGYGSEISFKTTGTVKDIDGNVYNIVGIGTQFWMMENLKTTKYRNGELIPNITNNFQWCNLKTGAYCNYNNSESMANTYGRLYNWYAVNDSRNIAPIGWHVATNDEWSLLTTYLGGANVAGGKLKEIGTTHWDDPNKATNESGFTALPGGVCKDDGFVFERYNGFWWTSTQYSTNDAWHRFLLFESWSIMKDAGSKPIGLSVRCVKD